MTLTKQIAKHFREVHFGGNWTWVNLKDTLDGITWQQATTQVHSFNTIAVLLFHTNYYVNAVLNVLKGNKLDSHDKYSFDHPPITSQADWDNMVYKALTEAEQFATLVEQPPKKSCGKT